MPPYIIRMPLRPIFATCRHRPPCIIVPQAADHRRVVDGYAHNAPIVAVCRPDNSNVFAVGKPHVLRVKGGRTDYHTFTVKRISEQVWVDVVEALGAAADAYADWLKPEPDTVVWQLWYE